MTTVHRHPLVLLLVTTLAAGALWAVSPLVASGQDEGSARSRLQQSTQRAQGLAGAVQEMRALEASAQAAVDVIRSRQAAAEADLADARRRLDSSRGALEETRSRLADQKERLGDYRATLASNLRAAYVSERPDLVGVVLSARGFADLIERVQFEASARDANRQIVDIVRDARDESRRTERRLERLVSARRAAAQEIALERDAIAVRAQGLEQRQRQLASARAARQRALQQAQTDRAQALRTLASVRSRIEAERRQAASRTAPVTSGSSPSAPSGGSSSPTTTGSGGSGASSAPQQSAPSSGSGDWAVPWAVVQCESGGQNVPARGNRPSGYYQFMPETWKRLGGSTDHAYQATREEQDRLAGKLWAGGSGSSNWSCASVVK